MLNKIILFLLENKNSWSKRDKGNQKRKRKINKMKQNRRDK